MTWTDEDGSAEVVRGVDTKSGGVRLGAFGNSTVGSAQVCQEVPRRNVVEV